MVSLFSCCTDHGFSPILLAMKIALVSLDQVWEDKAANKERCMRHLARATALGADLIVFPEMTLTGFSMNLRVTAERASDSPSLRWFARQAASFGIAIIAGYVAWNPQGTKGENTCVFLDSRGDSVASYVKVHPFSLSGEDQLFERGNSLCVCPYGMMSFGLSICYDLRFGELFQGLSRTSDVIVNIASWPEKRIVHWHTLLRARAIEHQVYMIGVNRSGMAPDGTTYAISSVIYDPFGREAAPLVDEGDLTLHGIEGDEVASVRASHPFKRDRREDLYRDLCLVPSEVDRKGEQSV